MAKLLDELGRGSKPAIPPSFSPCPLALADRDRREALRDQQSLTAAFFGDPLPGMSALDSRERERPRVKFDDELVPALSLSDQRHWSWNRAEHPFRPMVLAISSPRSGVRG